VELGLVQGALAGSEPAPEQATPRRPPLETTPVPVDGAPSGVAVAEYHDEAQGGGRG
jgi:hypothetical protein